MTEVVALLIALCGVQADYSCPGRPFILVSQSRSEVADITIVKFTLMTQMNDLENSHAPTIATTYLGYVLYLHGLGEWRRPLPDSGAAYRYRLC